VEEFRKTEESQLSRCYLIVCLPLFSTSTLFLTGPEGNASLSAEQWSALDLYCSCAAMVFVVLSTQNQTPGLSGFRGVEGKELSG